MTTLIGFDVGVLCHWIQVRGREADGHIDYLPLCVVAVSCHRLDTPGARGTPGNCVWMTAVGVPRYFSAGASDTTLGKSSQQSLNIPLTITHFPTQLSGFQSLLWPAQRVEKTDLTQMLSRII